MKLTAKDREKLERLERTIEAAGEAIGDEARELADDAVRQAREMPEKIAGNEGHRRILTFAAIITAGLLAFLAIGYFFGGDARASATVYRVLEHYETLPPCAGFWEDVTTGDRLRVGQISPHDIITCVRLG